MGAEWGLGTHNARQSEWLQTDAEIFRGGSRGHPLVGLVGQNGEQADELTDQSRCQHGADDQVEKHVALGHAKLLRRSSPLHRS